MEIFPGRAEVEVAAFLVACLFRLDQLGKR
jgi:hypothetical protein